MADAHNPATAQADADATAYERGSMAVNEQTATFALFMNLTKWGGLAVAVAVLFLVLWFHPGGSFIAGVLGALVLAVAGFVAFKGKKTAH